MTRSWRRTDARWAWAFVAPSLGIIAAVAVFPIGWTVWESLHLHDLRMPWLGRPFIGLSNYAEALGDPRLWSAVAHTTVFAALSVSLEMTLGLMLALGLDRLRRAAGVVRTVVLLPWAIPTVVAALVWRFMFESPAGLATTVPAVLGIDAPTWFADAVAAWVPLVLADVWKTTPFVALLLLAGLQAIDPALSEAAAVDGASGWQRFVSITLPLLRPALLVACLFRVLDALRVFDVIFVMTGGGPGTATESVASYTFSTLLEHLRFGYGAALSVLVFAAVFGLALAAVRVAGGDAFLGRRS
jgi:multiple sugar transport system permease protein